MKSSPLVSHLVFTRMTYPAFALKAYRLANATYALWTYERIIRNCQAASYIFTLSNEVGSLSRYLHLRAIVFNRDESGPKAFEYGESASVSQGSRSFVF